MKKHCLFVVFVLCLAAMFAGCSHSNKPVDMTKQERHLAAFTSINLIGSFDIVYRQSSKTAVTVEAPADIIDRVRATVDDECLNLTLESDGDWGEFNNVDNVTVSVSSPDLVGVSIAGSGTFTSSELVDTDVMHLVVVGSGDIQMKKLQCDHLKSTVTGSGSIQLNTLRTLSSALSVTGSGDISAYFLPSGAIDCSVIGSGDITVSGEVEHFQSSKAGTGSINASALRILSSSK